MKNGDTVALGTAGVAGAATGVVTASTVYGAAISAANAVGVYGAAATSSSLASLGGGALAAGGAGMAGGVAVLAASAALPAVIVGAVGFGIYKWLKSQNEFSYKVWGRQLRLSTHFFDADWDLTNALRQLEPLTID